LKASVFTAPVGLTIVGVVALAVHAGLLCFDLTHPDAFLAGDRGASRLQKIEAFLEATDEGSVQQVLTSSGGTGDYWPQALLYLWGGKPLLLTVQVILQLLSLVYVYAAGLLLLRRPPAALFATAVYSFLPGSLFHAHVLATEALYNPLVLACVYHGLRAFQAREPCARQLAYSAAAASLAAFTRPVFLLFPVLIALLLWIHSNRRRIRVPVCYLAGSLVIPTCWVAFLWFETGSPRSAPSDHDLAKNFYGRVERMSQLRGFDLEPGQQGQQRLGFTDYAGYLTRYPGAYVKTVTSDLANMTLNSGANTLLGRYLGLYSMPEKRRVWRHIRDSEGLLAMARAMYDYSPILFAVNALVTPVWLILLGLSAFGLMQLLRDPSLTAGTRALLVVFPAYILASALAATSVRWGFRTPLDWELCLLLAAAVGKALAGKTESATRRGLGAPP
jgi:hypothetical protein